MITYQLKCKTCKEITEVKQSIHDDLPKKCKCGGDLSNQFSLSTEHLYFTEHRGARTPRFK